MTHLYMSDLEDLLYEAHHKGILDDCYLLSDKIRQREGCQYLDFNARFKMAYYEITTNGPEEE